MENKILLLDVIVYESSNGSRWICSECYSDGNVQVRCFNMVSDFFAYMKPLVEGNVVLVVHNYSIDMINKLYNDALEEGFEL